MIKNDPQTAINLVFPFAFSYLVSFVISASFLKTILDAISKASGTPVPDSAWFTWFNFVVIVAIVFPFVSNSSGFVINPIYERMTRMRHLQRMMGSSASSYYCGFLLSDMIIFGTLTSIYYIISVLMFFVFHFDKRAGISENYTFILESYVLLMLFGFAVLNIGYFSTSFFDNYRTALAIVSFTNLITFVGGPFAIWLGSGLANLSWLNYLSFYSPFAPLGYTLSWSIYKALGSDNYDSISPLLTPVSVLVSIILFIMNIAVEDIKNRKIFPAQVKPKRVEDGAPVDPSVQEEERVVKSADPKDFGFSIVVDKLVKKYGDFFALSGPTFMVKEDQIFGLLG
jgi:ABC-2 family transporter protein